MSRGADPSASIRRPTSRTGVAAAVAVLTVVCAVASAAPARAAPVSTSSAWQWLRGQLGTGTRVTTASTISADRAYPPSWTGPVSGRFEVRPPAAEQASLEVHAVVVTDTEYDIGSVPAGSDGTFAFPDSRPGTKVFRLTDPGTGDVLAEYAPRTGLVRSFEVPSGHPLAGRTFTYDQSLALLCAISLGHDRQARVMADGLRRLQTRSGPQAGGFVVSAAALNPEAGRAEYRTGIHAVATYALIRYLQGLGPDDPDRAEVTAAVDVAVRWLRAQQAVGGPLDGLVLGGHGADRPGIGFDPGIRLDWASTEHNLDAWHALRLAATVGSDAAAAAAERVDEALVTRLWDDGSRHFLRGRSPSGPDPAEALDVGSWGAIQLQAAGRGSLAADALRHTAVFASGDPRVPGYGPEPPSGEPLTWIEGTAGVALAELRLGDRGAARRTLAGLTPAALPSGAWPGATRDDPYLDMTSAPAVAGTAWVVLVEQELAGRRSIWDETAHRGEPR